MAYYKQELISIDKRKQNFKLDVNNLRTLDLQVCFMQVTLSL